MRSKKTLWGPRLCWLLYYQTSEGCLPWRVFVEPPFKSLVVLFNCSCCFYYYFKWRVVSLFVSNLSWNHWNNKDKWILVFWSDLCNSLSTWQNRLFVWFKCVCVSWATVTSKRDASHTADNRWVQRVQNRHWYTDPISICFVFSRLSPLSSGNVLHSCLTTHRVSIVTVGLKRQLAFLSSLSSPLKTAHSWPRRQPETIMALLGCASSLLWFHDFQ